MSSAELEPGSAWQGLPKLAREVWFCHFWNIHWGLKLTGVDEWDWVAAVTFILFQTFDINYSPEYWTCLHFLACWRQFDLDSQRTCVQLQSDTKRPVLIAIHGTAAAGLGGWLWCIHWALFHCQHCSCCHVTVLPFVPPLLYQYIAF